MIWKAVILLGLALGSQAVIVARSEQKLRQGFISEHKELSHIGSHKPEHHEEYAWAYPSYEFSYSVNDPHTHDHKGQHEKRHGDEVIGEYWLLQPDGKKRTVKYQADKHKGFTAQVHYTDHYYHEEPHHEEIIIPVEEIVLEQEPEVPKHIEEEVREEQREAEGEEQREVQPEEQPEEQLEEIREEKQQEEHIEHKPRKPIHIEYYIQHKYKKHHDEQEKKQEPKEEKHEEIEHHIPIAPLEIYSKIHHPIHNEHHGHVQHAPVRRPHIELKEQHSREEHKNNEDHKPVYRHQVEYKEYHDILKVPERNREREEHKPVHHQIRYRPLINYNQEIHHYKAPEHKSPLLRLTLIDNEEKERDSEGLSPIRVSEVQAERKHHVEHPPHIPLLRLHKPIIHHQRNNPYYQEHHRRHYRSHGKQDTEH